MDAAAEVAAVVVAGTGVLAVVVPGWVKGTPPAADAVTAAGTFVVRAAASSGDAVVAVVVVAVVVTLTVAAVVVEAGFCCSCWVVVVPSVGRFVKEGLKTGLEMATGLIWKVTCQCSS